ncbi:MAG: antibiotic biosynthesis monooxygenase [Holdemanella sp.]|nr:antibiotic biosynthesis monooxygenase [Holdemanella sp.]
MYICLIKNKVKKGYEDAYYEVSCAFSNDMKSVDGCLDAYVIRDINNPEIIVNVEKWINQDAKLKDTGEIFLKYKADLKKAGFISNTSEEYI